MLISELDAVNGVLRELGEQPLTSTDTSYPTADLAKTALQTARIEFLQRGWWFNTVINYTVKANDAGQLALPDNVLEFIPDNPQLIWAGTYIMDVTGGVTFPAGTQAKGTMKFDVAFKGMPWSAQELITLLAASKVYVSDFGPDSKYQEIVLRMKDLNATLAAQHARAKRPSMAKRPAVQRYYNSLFT